LLSPHFLVRVFGHCDTGGQSGLSRSDTSKCPHRTIEIGSIWRYLARELQFGTDVQNAADIIADFPNWF
jgi:hypothetical protein